MRHTRAQPHPNRSRTRTNSLLLSVARAAFLFLLITSELLKPYELEFLGLAEDPQDIVVTLGAGFYILDLLVSRRIAPVERRLAYVVLATATLMITLEPFAFETAHYFDKKFIAALLTPLLIVRWAKGRREVYACMTGLVTVGLVGLVLAGLQTYVGIDLNLPESALGKDRLEKVAIPTGISLIGRGTGTLGTMGNYGSYMACTFYILVSGALSSSHLRKLGAVLAIPFGVTSFVISQSRSGIASLICGGLVFLALTWYYLPRRRRIVGTILAMGLVPLVASYLISLYDILWNLAPETITTRMQLNLKAAQFIVDYPLVGRGFGSAVSYFGLHHTIHNAFLKVTVALGLVGLALYLVPFFMGVRHGLAGIVRRSRDNHLVIGLLSGLTGVLVELNLYGGAPDKSGFFAVGIILAITHNLTSEPRTDSTTRPSR